MPWRLCAGGWLRRVVYCSLLTLVLVGLQWKGFLVWKKSLAVSMRSRESAVLSNIDLQTVIKPAIGSQKDGQLETSQESTSLSKATEATSSVDTLENDVSDNSTPDADHTLKYSKYTKSCNKNQAYIGEHLPDSTVVLVNGRPGNRTHRHVLSFLCGCKSDYHEQMMRLIKTIALTQGTTKYSRGNFNWDVWLLLDEQAKSILIPEARKLADVMATRLENHSRVTVHLLGNAPIMKKYKDLIVQIPFEPCGALFLFVEDILPSHVDEVVTFGSDMMVVDDLELVWDNAVEMGWNSSKLFANAEERARFSIADMGYTGWKTPKPNPIKLVRDCEKIKQLKPVRHKPWVIPKNLVLNPRRNNFHDYYFNGVGTGGHLVSVTNARKYRLSEWIVQIVKRFPPSTFHLGDQHIVNRYGMEFPERMTILQCNADIRAISNCDVNLHTPLVLHGTGGRFSTTRRPTLNTRHDQPFWRAFALAFDNIFTIFERYGEQKLPGSSIWTAIDERIRQGVIDTIGWGRNPVGATSPRVDLPPIGPRTNTSNIYEWRRTHLLKNVNVADMHNILMRTLRCS